MLTALMHLLVGAIATVALLAVLFETGFLVYDGALVQTTPLSVSQTVVHTPYGTEVSTHSVATSPLGLATLSLPIAGLFAGLSYALFGRRKS